MLTIVRRFAIITLSTKQHQTKKERIMTNSEIFKKAHAAARTTLKLVGDYKVAFQFALKEIYMNIKTEVVSIKDKLISLGLKVWEKGDMERIYINDGHLEAVFGLKLVLYKTNNICMAFLNGAKISNSKATKLVRGKKIYFDVKLNEFVNAGELVSII